MILLNIFLNFKSKHIIKGAIALLERKLGKITCESNLSEDLNIKKQRLKQTKRFRCVFFTTNNLRFVTI